ncbi:MULTISPECIES: ArsR/SmtB family transcription factor [Subtercola]|nr:helix-turn-helix domain-containing protein [Subtercola vilae]
MAWHLDLHGPDSAYSGLGVSFSRLEILRIVLARTEVSSSTVMAEMGMTRNGVTRHLEALRNAGLISERRTTHPRGSGPITYWRADRGDVWDAVDELGQYLLGPR